MIIEKAILKDCEQLQETRFAPYAGETVFIIDAEIILFQGEIIRDFDTVYYCNIFEVVEEMEYNG